MNKIVINIKHNFKFMIDIGNVVKLLLKSSKSTFFLIIICNIILGLNSTVILIISKNFIDNASEALQTVSKINDALFWLVIQFIIMILTNFLSNVSNYLQRMQSDYLNIYISDLLMDKISALDQIEFDNASIYDDIQKVNSESVSRSSSISKTIVSFIKNLTVLAGTVTIFIVFNPLIITLCFISTIPMFLVSVKISEKQFSLYNQRFEKLRLASYLKSIFIKNENVKEMKIYRIGKYFKNIIIDTYQTYVHDDKIIRKKFLRDITLTYIMESLISYGLKGYILFTAIRKHYSIGNLTMYTNAIEKFQGSIEIILQTVTSLYEDTLYINSLFSLLALNISANKSSNVPNINFEDNFKVIEFRNVWFKYPNATEYILKNINMKIEAEKVYSLVGLNGSGKTTLVKLLLKLYSVTKGEILIDNINIENYNLESIHKKIGVVFQDFIRFPLDVQNNIGLGNLDYIDNLEKIKNAAHKSGADKFIDKLPNQYKTKLQKEWTNGTDLSLGQWQKLAITRAFMAESSIVILDEPTASLDAIAEYNIFKMFRKMVQGKTCILIAHRFSTVRLADKIFVIKNGTIIEEGTHENLLKIKGEYCKLYTVQAKSYK